MKKVKPVELNIKQFEAKIKIETIVHCESCGQGILVEFIEKCNDCKKDYY